jgi:flagellar protein FlaG
MDIQQAVGSSSVAQSVSSVQPVSRPQVDVQPKAKSPEPGIQQVQQAVGRINETIQVFNPSLHFSVDSITDKIVVQVSDQDTKEVVRQIPSEEVLNIARSLEVLQGLLIRQRI